MTKQEKEAFRHQKDYEARQQEKGLVKVAAWVPACRRHMLLKYAKKLRLTPLELDKANQPA